MIASKWLVDEELAKNSSRHFELISTIVRWLSHQGISRSAWKSSENAHQNRDSCISQFCFNAALDLWLKGLFKFTLFTISKVATCYSGRPGPARAMTTWIESQSRCRRGQFTVTGVPGGRTSTSTWTEFCPAVRPMTLYYGASLI